MNMKLENLLKAIEIISEHHSTEIIINRVGEDNMANAKNLYITNCVPAVVNKLKDAGFSLSMHRGMLLVDDVFIKK